ncbi:phage tail tape measure protein [Flavobacterium sp.]|jgi:hypothetical protein|uniref:phage tail tape measure protein n=1 Tax=Flavobacterium sp. TaxID=239 RepID=UPI0037BF391E
MAENNQNVEVKISANASQLKEALKAASSSINQAAQEIKRGFSDIDKASEQSANKTVSNATKMKGAFAGIGNSLKGIGGQLQNAFSGITAGLGGGGGGLSSMSTALSSIRLGAVGAAAAVGTLSVALAEAAGKRLIRVQEDAEKLSLALNTTQSRAIAFTEMLESAKVKSDEFLQITQSLTKGLAKNQEVYERYNIAIKDSNGNYLSQEQIIGNIVKKYNEMADGTSKQIFLQQTLKGVSQDVFEKMNQAFGGDLQGHLDEVEKKLQRLGVVMNDIDVAKTKEYELNMIEFNRIIEGAINQFSAGLLPALNNVKKSFNDTFGDGSLAEMSRSIGVSVGAIIEFFQALWDTIKSIFLTIFNPIADAFNWLMTEIFGPLPEKVEGSVDDTLSGWKKFEIGIAEGIHAVEVVLQSLVTFFEVAMNGIIRIVEFASNVVRDNIKVMADTANNLKNGNFSAAADSFMQGGKNISKNWKEMMKGIESDTQKSMDGAAAKMTASLVKAEGKISEITKRKNTPFTVKEGGGTGVGQAIPKPSGGGGGDLMKSQYALMKAQLEAELMLLKDSLDREKEVLDQKLKDHLVSYKDYYEDLTRIQKEELAKQTEIKTKELEENQRMQSSAKGGDRLQLQAAAVKLQAELNILKLKEGDIERRNLQALKDKQEAMKNMVIDLKAQLANATNSFDPSAAIDQIQKKFEKMYEELIANGDLAGAEIVKRLIQVETAKAQIDTMSKEFDTFANQRLAEIEKINQAEKSGALSASQASAARHNLEITMIQKEIKLLEEKRAKYVESGDWLQVSQIDLAIAKLQTAQTEVNMLGQGINDAFASGIMQFFNDVASGTKSIKDAFSDMGKSIVNQINNIVAQWIAAKALGIFNIGGASTGASTGFDFSSLFSGLFGGFRESGGYVNPGSAYIVGEKGREVFVPNTPGKIVPNDALGSGGSTNITMNISTPDANSFRRSQGQISNNYASALSRSQRRNS